MNKQSKKEDVKGPQPQEVQVTTHPEITKGVYSNVAIIRHTPNEFIIDFLFQLDGSAQMVSRVILSTNHMKAFKAALEENIKMFEEKYFTKQ